METWDVGPFDNRFAAQLPDDGPLTATAIVVGVVGCGLGVRTSSNGQLSSPTLVADQFSHNSR